MRQENASMLKRWPSLLQALWTIKSCFERPTSFETEKQDVDLFTLLSDTSPFKLSIVRKQMSKEEEDIPYNFRTSYKEHAFEERLGLSYYLSTSRPLRALQHCIKGLEKPDIAMEITQQRKIHISSNISHLSGLVDAWRSNRWNVKMCLQRVLCFSRHVMSPVKYWRLMWKRQNVF